MAAWVIAGYARTPPPPDPDTGRRWAHSWAERFGDYAATCGHVLGPVRVDIGHDLVRGSTTCSPAPGTAKIVAVLVPGLDHLHAVPGLAGADTIRRCLRARVLTLPERPASSHRHA